MPELVNKNKGSGLFCGHDWSASDFNEELEECAKREVMEETGVKIKNIKKGTFTNDMFKKEGKHYITLYVISEHDEGEAKVMEPNRCEKWDWFEWGNLPEPLFLPLKNALKEGFNPF